MTQIKHPAASVAIRIADESDHTAIQYLAELDSALPLTGAAVVAELDEHVVAAISLADGREIADPFVPTSEIRELLRVRARQLKPRLAPHDRSVMLRSRRIPRARSLRLLFR